MNRHVLIVIFMALAITVSYAQHETALPQAPIQGLVPASKAKLEVAIDIVEVSIACPDECKGSNRWADYTLKEGYYYLDMTSCGCGQHDDHKKIRICTDGYECQYKEVDGGHLYRIRYQRGKGATIERMTRD